VEGKFNSMLPFPSAGTQKLFGVIKVNSSTVKTFSADEIYFISIIANHILSAVKFRNRFATSDR